MSGPADSKSVPGFDNWPRFVGAIEQNKISDSFDKYCTCYKRFNGHAENKLLQENLWNTLYKLL